MSTTNYSSLDVEGHDGSAAGLYLGGTLVTATAAEINKMLDRDTAQTLAAAGAITVKNGVVLLTNAAAPADHTLANPVAGTDDYKTLLVVCAGAQAHTVTSDDSFGGGGGGENKGTFTQVGDTLWLMAYNGKWYVTGSHHCTVD